MYVQLIKLHVVPKSHPTSDLVVHGFLCGQRLTCS